MASFIQTKKTQRGEYWYPEPGDYVEGRYGKHLVRGHVMASKKDPSKPAIFNRHGCVLCYIEGDNGKKMAINELRRI